MKVKGLIYCLLAFCMLALSSCGPDNTDYTEKVVGEYNIKITPNISVKYGNSVLPIATEAIETTAAIIEKDDDECEYYEFGYYLDYDSIKSIYTDFIG